MSEAVVTQQSWEQFTQGLAARLLRLSDGDTVIFSCGRLYTQLQQGPTWIRVEAASDHSLPPEDRLSPEQRDRLQTMGWQPPDPPLDDNWRVTQDWPLSSGAAARLAELVTVTMRDVYGVAEVDQIEEKAFNAFS